MSLRSLAIAYLLGGLTFLPLLVATVVTIAWYALPRTKENGEENGVRGVGTDVVRERERDVSSNVPPLQEDNVAGDAAASATFAVLRSYNFPAALSALNARNSTTGSGTSGAGGLTDGSTEGAGGSESVYQSMYRSVFDRNNKNAIANVVLGSENSNTGAEDDGRGKKKSAVVGASVFHILLRHGHLMLYDSPAQVEVRHVISLAHHTISLSEGPSRSDDGSCANDEEVLRDGELFVKRTAIVLTPIDQASNGYNSPTFRGRGLVRPFYLFSSTCSVKEDFYHALLTTRTPPPIPQPLVTEDLIKLQSSLHSSSLTPETRALNALIGRIFLSLHRTTHLETLIRRKIERKIERVQKPAFIASLAVESLDLGDAAPVLSHPRLKDLHISGDTTVAFTLHYVGGLRVVLTAVARLDLGYSRIKPRTLSLVLATTLQRLHAQVLVRVKPPPSNRIWFCFDGMPEMDVQVAPVVSQRQITYAFILRAIEERIRTVVGETLVKPNWDDIPFFDTRGQKVRGGIWKDEVEGELVRDGREGEGMFPHAEIDKDRISRLAERNSKTMSMPVLAGGPVGGAEAGDSSSSGSESATAQTSALQEQNAALKRRSVASLPLPRQSTVTGDLDHESPMHPPPLPRRPFRSPSFTSLSPSSPSVTLSDMSVGPAKVGDVTYQQIQRKSTWRSRASLHGPEGRKEAAEGLREMRDRDLERTLTHGRRSSTSFLASTVDDGSVMMEAGGRGDEICTEPEDLELANEEGSTPPSVTSFGARAATSSRSPSLREKGNPARRTDSSASSVRSVRPPQPGQGPRSKALLAATAAATTAARNWGWNALANRKTNTGSGTSVAPSSREMGQHYSELNRGGRGGSGAVKEPIGRGQPLPPPGVPLPGPAGQQKTLWQAAANGLGGVGRGMGMGIRRKPVPSGLSVRTAQLLAGEEPKEKGGDIRVGEHKVLPEDEEAEQRSLGERVGGAEEEFGPWRENSGLVEDGEGFAEKEMGSVHTSAASIDVGSDVRCGGEDAEKADDVNAAFAREVAASSGEDTTGDEHEDLVTSSADDAVLMSHMNDGGQPQVEEVAQTSAAPSSGTPYATGGSGSSEMERSRIKKVPPPLPARRPDMLKAAPFATATPTFNTEEDLSTSISHDHVLQVEEAGEENGDGEEAKAGGDTGSSIPSPSEFRDSHLTETMPVVDASEETDPHPLPGHEVHLEREELSAPKAVAAVSPTAAYPGRVGDELTLSLRGAEVDSLDDEGGREEEAAPTVAVAERKFVEGLEAEDADSEDDVEYHGAEGVAGGEGVEGAVT